MRQKRRSAPPTSLFDPPPIKPRPAPDALKEVHDLIKLFMLNLAAPPGPDEMQPPSGYESNGWGENGHAGDISTKREGRASGTRKG